MNITIKSIKAKAREWASMTDANNHSECRADIAKCFGLKSLEKAFNYLAFHDMHIAESQEQHAITNAMIGLIRERHGDKIADMVYNSL